MRPYSATELGVDMGRDLVRRPEGGLARLAGDARSTATIAFEGEAFTWASLPAQSRRSARHWRPVLAEQVGKDDGHVQRGQETVQVLRGWRLHRDALVVVVADRPVLPRGDHTVPVGSWRPVSVRRFDVVGDPQRRLGWVPAGVVPDRAGAGGPHTPVVPPHHAAQSAAAARTWPHLPAPVREGLVRAVPVPDDWLGTIVQRQGGSDPIMSQAITMLRRDETRGVVVVATRERRPTPGLARADEEAALAAADWLVDQLTFELRPRQLLDADRPVARLPWA